MQIVRPSTGDYADQRATGAAILGGEIVGDDPELLHRVRIQCDRRASSLPVVVIAHAVEQDLVIAKSRAAGPYARVRRLRLLEAGARHSDHSRLQFGELINIASV